MLLGNAVVFLAVLLAYDLLRPELETTGVGGIVLILIGYIGLRRRRRRRST
jgi:MYXO-CTERM domain-containing protein